MKTLKNILFRLGIILIGFGHYSCQKCTNSSEQQDSHNVKKVFSIARTSAYRSLDPVKQFDEASADLVSNLFDTLLDYHYLKRPYQLVPRLLTKLPENKGNKQYEFELRSDVYFNDDPCFPNGKGRRMTMDDVIYSLKRFADSNQNNLSYMLMAGFVKGLDEFREKTKSLGPNADYGQLDVEGLKKIDDFKMMVTLTGENPLALYPLAAPQTSIVPRECVKHYGEQFEHHPVGSGAFYISTHSRRGTMILSKNPRYFATYPAEGEPQDQEAGLLAAKGQNLPLIDEVQLPLIEETQPGMLSFLKGEVDIVGMDKANFQKMAFKESEGVFKLKPEYQSKFTIYREPGLGSEYMMFNMKDKIVGGYTKEKKALRQAFGYALNVPGYIDLILNGRAERLTSIVPSPIAGGQRDIPMEYFTYNVEKAKQKLAEAGFPNGKGLPTINIEYRAADSSTRQNFEYVRSALAEVGITVKANFQTFSTWLQRVEEGNFQLTSAGWLADYPDAENFYQLLYSKNPPPGPNHGSYNNQQYDELYLKSKYMTNGPERYELFKKMNTFIFEDAPIIIEFNAYRVGLKHNWLKNFKRNVMVFPPLEYVDIDMNLKATYQP